MKNMFWGLAVTGFLVLAVGELLAQTTTVLDGRNSKGVQRPLQSNGLSLGVGWSLRVNPDTTLTAKLSIDNPTPQPGGVVNYELLITNTGEKAVMLPRALDWGDVENESADQEYVKASVRLRLQTNLKTNDGGSRTFSLLPQPVDLYSTAAKPDTALVLQPGDSLRVLGTSVLPERVFGPPFTGAATLLGHLCVTSFSLRLQPV